MQPKKCLEYRIDGQSLIRTDNEEIMSGSRGYLYLRFDMDEQWKSLVCAVVFTVPNKLDSAVPVIDGVCAVPDSAANVKYFSFYVIGQDGSKVQISTNKEGVKLK